MPTTEPLTIHQTPGIREHRRRFRIDGERDTRRFANALEMLDAEAVARAFAELGLELKSLADVKAALTLLVRGPDGAFRVRGESRE